MQKFTQKWSLVAFLEPVQEGAEFFWKDWPLHVTLADVFAIHLSGVELTERLSVLLVGQKPIKLRAEKQGYWGEDDQTLVILLQQTPEVVKLHKTIYNSLVSAGAVFNEPQYQDDGFSPHVTVQKNTSLKPGDEVKIDNISVIDMFPRGDGYQRKVLKSLRFTSLLN